ncbi:hypothetical protein HK101_010558 [Irineochytrium annulatum]|nr:hypothetical protein HK101_010558 [Irineochytrium annulatum]
MIPAIDTRTHEGCNLEPEAVADKKPDVETEKTVEDLLAFSFDGVFRSYVECIYRLPAYRNAWRDLVFNLAALGAEPLIIEYMVKTGGLSLMERDSENATILTVAATHKRRDLCDYLLGTSVGRALFFDLANSQDTWLPDEANKLLEEDMRRTRGEESIDAGGEDTPKPLPVERLMLMDNPVLLETFLDNIRRYKWASDCFIALKPVLLRCLTAVLERKEKFRNLLFLANSTMMFDRTKISDEIDKITSINEMHARLTDKLDSIIFFMTIVNLRHPSQKSLMPVRLRDRPWDEVKCELATASACSFAKSAEDHGLLEWFLDDYCASFEVSMCPVMDAVVLGHWGAKTVGELMQQHVMEAEGGEVYQHRRAFFEEVVVNNWDGDAGTLVDTFKTAYLEATLSERFKDQEGLAEGWRSNRKAALHSDEGWEERLERIKALMGRIDDRACVRIPRFHLLVVAGEVNILRWLRAEKHVDLSTQLYPIQDIAEDTAELSLVASDCGEDEDNCAVCLRRKVEPQTMDCMHSFCKACVHKIYICVSPSTPAACPLCRRAFPLFSDGDFTPSKFLAVIFKQMFPFVATVDVSATVGDALFFIAAWVGNVVVVAYLIDECGVDPYKVWNGTGLTANHLACMHGHVAVARWLRSRDASFFDSPTPANHNGTLMTVVDALVLSDFEHTFDIVRDFSRRGWLPQSWVKLGRSSPNARVARYAMEVGTEMCLLTIEKALGNVEAPQPLEVIVSKIKDECLEDPPASLNPFIAQVYEAAVAAGRYDALRWIATERGRWWDVMVPLNLAERKRREGDQAFMEFCAAVDVAVDIRRTCGVEGITMRLQC